MHIYGFSTGALALGEFEKGIRLLSGRGAEALELSALRDHELPRLAAAVPDLELSEFEYVSVHAPSKFVSIPERQCAELLSFCIDRRWPVVLHPDAINQPGAWDDFGELLLIENMDKRKTGGRTLEELTPWFERFPEAGFCLDLGHARQVDPSLREIRRLTQWFGQRLRQIHLSELDSSSRHRPLSLPGVSALHALAERFRPVAVILESQVEEDEISLELDMAKRALEPVGAEATR